MTYQPMRRATDIWHLMSKPDRDNMTHAGFVPAAQPVQPLEPLFNQERSSSMKVKTNLKAGNTAQTLSQQASSAASSTIDFLNKANRDARKLSLGTARVSSSLYNCVTKSFGLG
jgi:hypothetical protein